MYRFFIQSGQVGLKETGGSLSITGSDVNHISNVLRMKVGEVIDCVDETGRAYLSRISSFSDQEVTCEILEVHDPKTELANSITLYMGLPKSDKPELIIQKAVELGADRIVPVVTRYTVVKLDQKKAEKKRQRWQAVAEAAAKQSKRAIIPEVAGIMSFREALEEAKDLDVLLLPYEREEGISHTRKVIRDIQKGQSLGVFVGPEGGFSREEVDQAVAYGAETISLGHRILRAETACITVLGILMYELDAD